jgi:uncharacterized membrane protein
MRFKRLCESLLRALVAGILLLAPIYLAILLVLKAMKSAQGVVKPLTRLFPVWFAGEGVVSLSIVLLFCLLIGLSLRTAIGQRLRARIESSVLQKIPGYTVFRAMSQQLAGSNTDSWKPALAEIEEALVPAFIVEELEDGRFTVFVPSVPTPLAGTIYILTPDRVHPLDVPFTQAVKAVTKWGSGSKDLVAVMEGRGTPSPATTNRRSPIMKPTTRPEPPSSGRVA